MLSTFVITAAIAVLGLKIFNVFPIEKNEPAGDEIASNNDGEPVSNEPIADEPKPEPVANSSALVTKATSSNCTIKNGYLMLINPNFTVETSFIATRKTELISLSYHYGIQEANRNNGDNLMDPVAAAKLYEMVNAYKVDYPGHEIMTRSCFRERGTNCGRMCYPTGTTDHHTGLTCDLIDQSYGSSLDTSLYNQHPEWRWLKANSYKYGFIDRFPSEWAGGPMTAPRNLNEVGTTGLYETWHYRYVGVEAATEIATGKYNNGQYDSLEHYLLSRGLVTDLINATCKAN